MITMRVPEHLVALAARQGGVVTRPQALAAGLTTARLRGLVEAQQWQRPFRGVFVAHNGPIDFVTKTWAAVSYAGRGAVASHETAAHLAGLIDTMPTVIDLTVPSSRRVEINAHDVHIRYCADDLMRQDPVRKPPMTPPPHTVLDLIHDADTADRVVALVAAACQRRLASPGVLLAMAAGRNKLRWRALLLEICGDVRLGIESPLERRYLHDVERAHRLPAGTRQRVVRIGQAMYRQDVAYEPFGVVVELDGLVYHRGGRVAADAARDNLLASSGLIILRYRWADVVNDPCGTARQVAVALQKRGWTGALRPCNRCRAS